MIDTHAHLQHPAFAADREAVLTAARAAGVALVVDVADDLPSAREAMAFALKVSGVRVAVGIHPHKAQTWNEAAAAELAALCRHPLVAAVGEIGLDYHYEYSPRRQQAAAFREQLVLAAAADLPVIVHVREAEEDALAILREAPPVRGVWHCFWSTAARARSALELGLYIGVGGSLTFRNAAELRQVIAQLPLERLLLETDAPYLAPAPHRGRRNEPAFVRHVAEALAQTHGGDLEQVARITTQNALALFATKAETEGGNKCCRIRPDGVDS